MPELLRSTWKRAPEPWRRAVGRTIHPLATAYTRRLALRSLGNEGTGLPAIVGWFGGSSGIALSAQLASRALHELGIQHRCVEVGDLADPAVPEDLSSTGWMFHLNAPELMILLRRWGADRLRGRRFGYWAWELPRAPSSWLKSTVVLDGVIAPSRFTAEAFAGSKTPVAVAPHPMVAADFDRAAASAEFLRDGVFRVISLFDFKSAVARKNPLGAIRAFSMAFGDDTAARLVLKTSNADFAPHLMQAVKEAARPNVQILDERWGRDRLLEFIASADVLLSLHRSEGFGLTIAEAMMLGVPVVATAWSGNLDFMDEETACLVPAKLRPVDDQQGIYRGQVWAEPDEYVAADGLRRLRADKHYYLDVKERAKVAVESKLSPEAWLARLPTGLRTAFDAYRL